MAQRLPPKSTTPGLDPKDLLPTRGIYPIPATRGARPRHGWVWGALVLIPCTLWSWATTASPHPPDTASPAPVSTQANRLILISWDGGGDLLLDTLLAEERLPHLARLAARGARAAHVVGTVPTKTAPSHASIYTGCGPGIHGVSSNSVVHADDPSDHTALESYRGFSSTALRAEPIFVSTARQGWDTTVLAASHYVPHTDLLPFFEEDDGGGNPSPKTEHGSFRSFSPFETVVIDTHAWDGSSLGPALGRRAARAAGWSDLPPHRGPVREMELTPRRYESSEPIFALIFDSKADPTDGFDRLLLRVGSRGAAATAESVIGPAPAQPQPANTSQQAATAERARRWSKPLEVRRDGLAASTFFRLFELDSQAERVLLYRRKASSQLGHFNPEDLAALERAWPGGYDDPFRAYQWGRLGLPLPDGGDGRAEERLVEIAAFESDLLIAGSRFAWHRWEPRALFHYTPMLDHAAHTWMALLDPASSTYTTEVGPRLWQFYARLVGEVDRWLGSLLDLAEETPPEGQTLVALVSDHGMAWADREFFPNVALEQAGLLYRDADGNIDLTRSLAFSAELDFAIRLNDARWKGGIVPPERRQEILEKVADALLAARDPETGQPLVRRVFLASDLQSLHSHDTARPLDLSTLDLYFDPAPGLYPRGSLADTLIRPMRQPWGNGSHGYWPERRDMHSIFYLAGPGIRSGVEIPAVRQIDIAPTLATALGLAPPRQSCGRVSYEALDIPRP